MNREKFEKLIAIIEKMEKNGYFSTKNKIKAAIEALFIMFKQNPLDIFFWPFYFLHLFSLRISKILRLPSYSFFSNILNLVFLPTLIKKNVFDFDKIRYKVHINMILEKLNKDEKEFLGNLFAQMLIIDKEQIQYEFLNYVYPLSTIDQYQAKEFIKNGDYVLDCGANIGIFSLYAAYLNEKGKIYAIEPVKETAEIMQRLLDFFEVKNVKIIRKAVGDEKKKTFINIVPYQIRLGGSTLLDVNYGKKEEIEVDTIDNIVKEEKIEKVDFIKMDIEGYERYALKGAIETIKKHKPIIVVSAYHLADDKKVLPEIVKSAYANYEVKLTKEAEEDFIFMPKDIEK
jgi:FkbM family methyltransferase